MQSEEWRDVVGWVGIYEVSNLGRVRNAQTKKVRAIDVTPRGYARITLWKNGKHTKRSVHHLVAEVFVGERQNGLAINHIDGDKLNNRPENLEWVTDSENLLHAYATGLKSAKGQKNGAAKLTDDQVRMIRDPKDKRLCRVVAEIYGVSDATISRIRQGVIWKSVL